MHGVRIMHKLRKKGYSYMKIGYTTGVFDLFHVGHLNILKKAKENCDYLIVGVSTDELVMKYKNRKPIIKYDERFEIVQAIKYVDLVVPQDSLDKIEAWEKLKFNVLFHGDDWKNTDLYLNIENELNARGVKVMFFSHTNGISTTEIKQCIYEHYLEDN